MKLLHPQLLPLVILTLIPVIIYILFRRKKKDVPWGSYFILELAMQSKNRSNVWKQYCILLLRTVALAAIVFFFLAPFMPWDEGRD